MKGVLDFRAFSQPVSTTGDVHKEENIGNFDGMPMLGGPGIRALTPPSSLHDQQNHPTDQPPNPFTS